jgi:L-fuculose-phosphate aldolase
MNCKPLLARETLTVNIKITKIMIQDIDKARELLLDAGKRLLAEGLVARTWGNISLKTGKETMLVTPSGRDYEEVTASDMVPVNFITLEYEGKIKPSSEYKMHAEIYKTRKEINAVIHTHQMNASTVAAARREVPPILDDMAQIIGPSVRVAEYALPSTKKIVKCTVKALKGRMAALMANHGAVCIGRDIEEAFVVCQVLEKACKAFIEAEFLGGAKEISKFESWIMHQYYLKKYSKSNKENK